MFLGFTNFYWQFIQGFNKIAGQLTSMLRTGNSSENLLILVDVANEDEVVGGGDLAKQIRICLSPKNQKFLLFYLM